MTHILLILKLPLATRLVKHLGKQQLKACLAADSTGVRISRTAFIAQAITLLIDVQEGICEIVRKPELAEAPLGK